jgi:hypothetical protein
MAVWRGGSFCNRGYRALGVGIAVIARYVKFPGLVLAACAAWGFALLPFAYAETTIVIVRHGEKPAQGLGQLSCMGLNRSLALAPVLLSRYGIPAAIYAPNPAVKKVDKGVSYSYIRPLATIEPLAIRAGLPVNLDWGITDTGRLAEALLARGEGTQVVAWEHHLAGKLAKQLLEASGGNPAEVPDWEDADFDSIYVIRVAGQDKDRRATFSRESEGLNHLPDKCSK